MMPAQPARMAEQHEGATTIAPAASAVSCASTRPGGYHSSRPSCWRDSSAWRTTITAGAACTSANIAAATTPAIRPQTRIAPAAATHRGREPHAEADEQQRQLHEVRQQHHARQPARQRQEQRAADQPGEDGETDGLWHGAAPRRRAADSGLS